MVIDRRLVDLITVGFELTTAVSAWADVRALYRARDVRGVSLLAVSFRTLGGFWQWALFVYMGLFWASLLGAVWALAAVVWLVLAVRSRS